MGTGTWVMRDKFKSYQKNLEVWIKRRIFAPDIDIVELKRYLLCHAQQETKVPQGRCHQRMWSAQHLWFPTSDIRKKKKCYSRGYAIARCQAKTTLKSYWHELRDHQEYSKIIAMKTGTHTQVLKSPWLFDYYGKPARKGLYIHQGRKVVVKWNHHKVKRETVLLLYQLAM